MKKLNSLINAAFWARDAQKIKELVGPHGLVDSAAGKKFLKALQVSGCLLIKKEKASEENKRMSIIEVCDTLFEQLGDTKLTREFKLHVIDALLVEKGFRAISQTLDLSEISKFSMNLQAWSALHRGIAEFEFLHDALDKRIEEIGETSNEPFDPSQLRIQSKNGFEINPHHVDGTIISSVGATLFLLAYKNDLFDPNSGHLILPIEAPVNEDLVIKAGTHVMLSTQWRHLERMWDRARFFNRRIRTSNHDVIDSDERTGIELLEGEIPLEIEKFAHIAESRLTDIFAVNEMKFETSQPQVDKGRPQRIALLDRPSVKFISIKEAIGYQILSSLFCLPCDDHTESFGGLPLWCWLRGYAFLGQQACDSEGSSIYGLVKFSKDELVSGLIGIDLNIEQANIFIDAVTFQRGAIDLYDAPLLKLADNSYRFFAPAHHQSVPSTILLSRLSSMNRQGAQKIGKIGQVQFLDKGTEFEKRMLLLFLNAGLPAKSFKYNLNKVPYYCDLAVLMDRTLFIFECKNYNIPMGRISELHHYDHDLKEFGDQAKRICCQLSENPHIIRKHFGKEAEWDSIVPVVLQALPWSMGLSDGVYYYDQSALERYINDGTISAHLASASTQKEYTVHLRRLEKFYAADFLNELKNPAQLRRFNIGWELLSRPAPIAERFYLALPEWHQRSLNGQEKLAALGFREADIAEILSD